MPILFDQRAAPDQDFEGYQWHAIELSHDERARHRLAVMLPNGQAGAIVLARGQQMHAGDVLVSSNGHALRIQAQAQPLMRVSAPTGAVLLRLVYHLANRHVRAMLASDAVYIEPDAVLAQMVQQLGGQVSTVQMAFEPEPGAYHGGHHHGEASSHDADMGRIGEMLSIAAHKGRDHG